MRVVATVSAMGDTTDTLLEPRRRDLANPHPRELDMLLSTGERISCALVAMAVHDLGHGVVSFTGSQAGILTDPVHTKAKIRKITLIRVVEALDRGRIVLVVGVPGLLAGHDGRDDARPRRDGCHRSRTRGRARRVVRDRPTSRGSSRLTRASSRPPACSPKSRTRRCSRCPPRAPGAMLRAVEMARGHSVRIHARSTFSGSRAPGSRTRREWRSRSSLR